MAGLTQQIPNYVLGISEQPDELKAPGQVVDLKNALPDITHGCTKRPGGKLISAITPNSGTLSWFHIYETEIDQYIGNVNTSGVIQVWRTRDGASIPIDYANVPGTNACTYLSGWTDSTDIQSLVVNYNTFLTNRNTTVGMLSGSTSPAEVHEAIIELKTISHGKQYALDIFEPSNTSTVSTNRATSLAVRDGYSNTGANDGNCAKMGRETIRGANNLTYEIDMRCQPIAEGGGSTSNHPNYNDSYQAFCSLQFGGEGFQTGDTQTFTMEKGIGGTVEVKSHETFVSRANLAAVRPAPTSANSDESITAATILGGLKSDLDADFSSHGVTATIVGNCLHLKKNSVFNVTTTETNLMNIVTSEVNSAGDLPKSCRHNYVVKVVNSADEEDDYYLKFQMDNVDSSVTADRFGTGIWEECPAPGININMDADTLPVRLERGDPSTQWEIATSAVDVANDSITITAHGRSTGDAVFYNAEGGTVLTGLSNNTTYYVIKVDDNRIELATTESNATSGTKINLTGTGTNAQTLTYGAWGINGTNPDHYPNGIFRITKPPWIERLVGDETTNPEPSFIGKKISKLLFFRNRLVMLSENNVICSQTNDFYNFFSKTAQSVSNGDPIDLKSSSLFPTVLYDGIEVNSGLLLHSSNQQFMLTTDSDAFTPQTAKINYLSSYNYNPKIVPFSLGTTTGFVNSTGNNARFFEISEARREGEPSVVEQSKLISKKLPIEVTDVTVSKENGIVLFGSENTSTATDVWGYKYFSNGERRIQSAWFRWELPGTLIHHKILDDVYYVVLKNGTNYTLEAYDVKKQDDTTLIKDYIVHLDTHSTITALSSSAYHSQTDKTTFTKPAGYNSTKQLAVYDNNAGNNLGRYAKVTVDGSNLIVDGNWTGVDFILGYLFEWLVELPKIYPAVQSGGKPRSDTRGSLIVHRLKFGFGSVGLIETTLKKTGRTDYSQTYESLEWDKIQANSALIADEYIHTIPVYERNTNLTVQLKSIHPSPATLHSMNWEGDYNPKYYRRA